MNVIQITDGYKLGHRQQYPDGTTFVYSNFTPRSSRNGDSVVVFFGLQAFLERWMEDEFDRFFAAPRHEVCRSYAERLNAYLGENSVGTDHVAALHDLGYVPLEFRALPEGTLTPLRVPMLTVHNTHPDFFWLVNYVETLLSCELWLPCTSATTARRYRLLLDDAARRTGTPTEIVPFQAHDFSMRGMSGVDAAMLSAAGHLLSFVGTDTFPALEFVERHYTPSSNVGADYLIGTSVPATEHSVMCAGGKETEFATFERLLSLYPTGVLSIVSDTWDLWHVLTDFLPRMREVVLARDGKLVIRPDSGDPVDILCGDPDAPEGSPARAGVVELLWRLFGGSTTSTGHRMLAPQIGVIYGDSITLERCAKILARLDAAGYASGNVVFGVGSFTYQYVTRDTYGMAMKATYAVVDGESRELFKDPVTDSGTKRSARGLLAVRDVNGTLRLFDRQTRDGMDRSLLAPVWRNGRFLRRETFDGIRARLGLQT